MAEVAKSVTITVPLPVALEFVHLVRTYTDSLQGAVRDGECDFTAVTTLSKLVSAKLPAKPGSKKYYELLEEIRKAQE